MRVCVDACVTAYQLFHHCKSLLLCGEHPVIEAQHCLLLPELMRGEGILATTAAGAKKEKEKKKITSVLQKCPKTLVPVGAGICLLEGSSEGEKEDKKRQICKNRLTPKNMVCVRVCT